MLSRVLPGSADEPITWHTLKLICRLRGSAVVVEHGQLLSTLCVNMAFAVIATRDWCQALSFPRFNILFGTFDLHAQKQVSGWRAKVIETSARSLYISTGNSKRCKRRTCEALKGQDGSTDEGAMVLVESANNVWLTDKGRLCKRSMLIANLCFRLDTFSRIQSPKSEIYCFKFYMRLHTTFRSSPF